MRVLTGAAQECPGELTACAGLSLMSAIGYYRPRVNQSALRSSCDVEGRAGSRTNLKVGHAVCGLVAEERPTAQRERAPTDTWHAACSSHWR